MVVVIAQDEAHGGEEVALARPIATDDNVALGRKGLNLRLVLVATFALATGFISYRPTPSYLLKPWIVICLM